MELTSTKIDEFFQQLAFAFNQGQEATPTLWKDIAMEVPSSTEKNVFPFLQMIPGLREWLGPRVINNLSAKGYELVNKHWEDTFGVDRDKLEDDQYGMFAPATAMLGQHAEEWPDRELARVVEAGSVDLCMTGQPFFSASHPVDLDNAGGGTQSNRLVGAGFDLTAGGSPLIAYKAARAAFQLWTRPDGMRMGAIPDTIMVHPNEEGEALAIQKALLVASPLRNVAGTENVASAGVTNVFSGMVRVIVNPYLTVTSGKPWYLLATNRIVKPFLWQVRKAAELVQLTQVTDQNVFSLRQFLYGLDLRGAGGYGFPWLAFRMSAS